MTEAYSGRGRAPRDVRVMWEWLIIDKSILWLVREQLSPGLCATTYFATPIVVVVFVV